MRRGNTNDLLDFITTEIIEKLIEDIPLTIKATVPTGSLEVLTTDVKQQLRDKWLN